MPKQTRYNLVNYNSARYNGGPLSVTLLTDPIVFNGFSLANNTTIFNHSIDDSGPSRRILGGNSPRDDGQFLNAEYWEKKFITISGTVSETTSALLETAMDTIRKNLRTAEADLDLTRNSIVRRYKATLVNMDSLFPVREHFHTTWIPFEAKFECRTPFAEDRSYSNVTQQITTTPLNITDAENLGTIEAQPIIYAIFDAANTVTVLNIKRINPVDGSTLDEIEYSGTLAAGDVFEFNSETKKMKKNGVEVNYTGAFPILDVGGNVLTFDTTGTSFDYFVTVKWKNRYL